MALYSNLIKGLNLFGLTSGVNMEPGEASDAINVIPRPDGSLVKHWGARRLNLSRLTEQFGSRVLNQVGFTYKGKNNNTTTNPGRAGNFGVADDGDPFTRRTDFYAGALVLTETEARFWDHANENFGGPVTLPAGVTIDPKPRPSFLVLQNNVYIVGWATSNLRFDPTDRALYEWGWDSLPTLGAPSLAAGGDLQADKVYKYRAAWIDLYTGEQSGLGPVQEITPTGSNLTVEFQSGDFPAYAGLRHFKDGVNASNQDVGIVLYRTEADEEAFHFLDLVTPDLAVSSVTDDGLATDAARHATTVAFEDPPKYSGFAEYRNMVYGLSFDEGEGSTRIYFNDFTTTKSHYERTQPLNFREFPLTKGDVLTAIAPTDYGMILFSQRTAFSMQANANQATGLVQHTVNPLEWSVGCVGPLAWTYFDGWLYWLSDRGPFRWRQGLPQPQWIGRNLMPLFIDFASGLCKLNPAEKDKSEVFYDQDADVVRYYFPTGSSPILNQHIYQYYRTEFLGDDYSKGWFFGQPYVNSSAMTPAYGKLDPATGVPEDQFSRKARHVFADHQGFLYEYDMELGTFGWEYPGVSPVFLSFSVTSGSKHSGQDVGYIGNRFEFVYADGTIFSGTYESDGAAGSQFDKPAPKNGTGTLFIAGFRSYWRSWLDTGGDPSKTKVSVHFWVGHAQLTGQGVVEPKLDVVMTAADDIPVTAARTRAVSLSKNQNKVISSLTGRYFLWEFANSRPDEKFHVTFVKTDLNPLPAERQ